MVCSLLFLFLVVLFVKTRWFVPGFSVFKLCYLWRPDGLFLVSQWLGSVIYGDKMVCSLFSGFGSFFVYCCLYGSFPVYVDWHYMLYLV